MFNYLIPNFGGSKIKKETKSIFNLEEELNLLKKKVYILEDPFKFKVGQNVYLKNDCDYIKVKIIKKIVDKYSYSITGYHKQYEFIILKSACISVESEYKFKSKKEYKAWQKNNAKQPARVI